MVYDSSQLKYANDLKEAALFCSHGFSYRQELYTACQLLETNPEYSITNKEFSRKNTRGTVEYTNTTGDVEIVLDNSVYCNSYPARDHSLMLRLIDVHGKSRRNGLFKQTTTDISTIFKPTKYCITAAIKPSVHPCSIENYRSLKLSMQKHLESLGWFRLTLIAFSGWDWEITERLSLIHI